MSVEADAGCDASTTEGVVGGLGGCKSVSFDRPKSGTAWMLKSTGDVEDCASSELLFRTPGNSLSGQAFASKSSLAFVAALAVQVSTALAALDPAIILANEQGVASRDETIRDRMLESIDEAPDVAELLLALLDALVPATIVAAEAAADAHPFATAEYLSGVTLLVVTTEADPVEDDEPIEVIDLAATAANGIALLTEDAATKDEQDDEDEAEDVHNGGAIRNDAALPMVVLMVVMLLVALLLVLVVVTADADELTLIEAIEFDEVLECECS